MAKTWHPYVQSPDYENLVLRLGLDALERTIKDAEHDAAQGACRALVDQPTFAFECAEATVPDENDQIDYRAR